MCDARFEAADEQERPLVELVSEPVLEAQVQRDEHGHETAAAGLGCCTAGDGGRLRLVARIRHDPPRRSVPNPVQHVQERWQRQGMGDRRSALPRDFLRQVVETDVVAGDEVAGSNVVVCEVAIVE